MKKILTSVLALLSVFAFATGCDFLPGNKDNSTSSDVASESIADSVADSSEADVEEDEDLATAADYLKSLYTEKDTQTRQDYEILPAILGYPISWSVDVTENVAIVIADDGKVWVDVNENLDADLTYVLTATLSNETGETKTVSFTRTVLAAPSIVPEAITEAPVEGVAYKYHVYQSTLAQDMYFAGGMAATYYFKTTLDTAEAVDIYVDYVEGSTTEFYVYFEHTTDGTQYFGVKVSDDGAHDNIVYTSSPISTFVWNAELGTITTHLEATKNNGGPNDFYFGNYGTKDTISASYLSYAGGDGNNVGHLVTLVDRNSITPEVKAAFEKEALAVDVEYTGDKTVELATLGIRYTDVTIAWSIAENANATIANNTLTIVAPTAETTVVLTATITCGEVVETKEFTLTLKPAVDGPAFDTEITIAQAIAIGSTFEKDNYTEGKYYIVGTIKEVYNTTYGNMYLTDAEGNQFTVYGTYSADGSARYDAMESKPVAGDIVKVYGIIGYYSAPQMKNGWIIEWTPGSGSNTPDDSTSSDDSSSEGGEAVLPEGETVTLTIADYATENSWANSTPYDTITMKGCTVTASGTPVGDWGLNTGKFYTNGNNWRIYQNENPSLTFTAVEGLNIVAVKITYEAGNTGTLTLNGTNVASDEVVLVDASSITFSVGNTGTATNGQARITAITIVLEDADVVIPDESTSEDSSIEDSSSEDVVVPDESTSEDSSIEDSSSEDVVVPDESTSEDSSIEDSSSVDSSIEDSSSEDSGEVDTHEHSYTPSVTAPTCTADGYTTFTCACGDTYKEAGETATGHSGYEADYKCDACSAVVEPEADSVLTIPQAIALANAIGIGKYSNNSYYMTVIVESIYNTQYGNANVVDAEGNKYVLYGLYMGETRYDALNYKPVAGDELTVYGQVGSYSSTSYQIKNAQIDEIVAHEHNYVATVTDPTCTAEGYTTHTCSICSASYVDAETEALGHTTEAGTCERCGKEIGGEVTGPQQVALFDFGANGSAAHVDGNDYGTSKTFTAGSYSLALTNMSKVYGPAYDAKGNSCIKFGTSSKAGSMSFTVPENVTKVVLYVAKYKANNASVTINNVKTTLTKNSNDGAYDVIEVDTTTTKTVSFAVSSGYRCMINTIEFWA